MLSWNWDIPPMILDSSSKTSNGIIAFLANEMKHVLKDSIACHATPCLLCSTSKSKTISGISVDWMGQACIAQRYIAISTDPAVRPPMWLAQAHVQGVAVWQYLGHEAQTMPG